MSNIWTKKLEETRIGGWVVFRIIPAIMIISGINDILNQKATIKSMEYQDGDAILLGTAMILIALSLLKIHIKQNAMREKYLKDICFLSGAAIYVYVCLIKWAMMM